MFRKRQPPVGSMPGALALNLVSPPPRISAFILSGDTLEERSLDDWNQIPSLLRPGAVTWIDVQGLGDGTVLQRIAELLSLHPLAVADVVNVPQRPKADLYEGHLFLVMRMARLEASHIECEQVSAFLGANYLLTFQEKYGDVLDPLRNRLRAGKGAIRQQCPDYLAYAVLDTIIDGYYPVLETLGDRLIELEEEALENPSNETLRGVNRVRNELAVLRRGLWPQREAINSLIRDPNAFVTDPVRIYLRDALDHCLQITEVVESYREIAGAATNIYLSSLSNRMNEVMKLLTIVATIFVPLTFLVGIYGMNFDYMPELHNRYAYPMVWFLMGFVAIGMLIYFRRRGWIGKDKER